MFDKIMKFLFWPIAIFNLLIVIFHLIFKDDFQWPNLIAFIIMISVYIVRGGLD